MRHTFCSNIESPARYFNSSEQRSREILSSILVSDTAGAAVAVAPDTNDAAATTAAPPLSSGLCSSAVFIGFRSVVFDDFGGILSRSRSITQYLTINTEIYNQFYVNTPRIDVKPNTKKIEMYLKQLLISHARNYITSTTIYNVILRCLRLRLRLRIRYQDIPFRIQQTIYSRALTLLQSSSIRREAYV